MRKKLCKLLLPLTCLCLEWRKFIYQSRASHVIHIRALYFIFLVDLQVTLQKVSGMVSCISSVLAYSVSIIVERKKPTELIVSKKVRLCSIELVFYGVLTNACTYLLARLLWSVQTSAPTTSIPVSQL
jgi:hypothetical protein